MVEARPIGPQALLFGAQLQPDPLGALAGQLSAAGQAVQAAPLISGDTSHIRQGGQMASSLLGQGLGFAAVIADGIEQQLGSGRAPWGGTTRLGRQCVHRINSQRWFGHGSGW